MHEVYISYTEEDEKIANEICNLFEENGFSCWFKKRDFGENDSVSKITQAIRDSKRVVLVYSKYAENSNFIRTEIDISFAENLPILVFNTDGTSISSQLQFYLEGKTSIEAYPNTKSYYEQLLEATSQLDVVSKMKSYESDAYICYATEDNLTADAICHVLESNNMKCWFKNRDMKINDSVKKINDAIKNSKSLVLVYSEDAKKSNYVKTELEIANSSDMPIISFKIDESPSDELKSLKDAHWLEAFPNAGKTFKTLVNDVSTTIGKDIGDPLISKEYENLKVDKKPKQKVENKKEDLSQDFETDYGIGKNFKKIAIGITAILVVILLVVYISNYIFIPDLTGTQLTISNGNMEISNSETVLPTIDVKDISSNNCHIEFSVEDKPDNFDNYIARINFMDDTVVIDEFESPMKDLQKGEKGEFAIDYTYDEDVSKLYFEIINPDRTVIYDNVL